MERANFSASLSKISKKLLVFQLETNLMDSLILMRISSTPVRQSLTIGEITFLVPLMVSASFKGDEASAGVSLEK